MASGKTASPFFRGFLTGLAVGLVLALIVAVWTALHNPFVETPKEQDSHVDAGAVKEAPSYEFYKTLPGGGAENTPTDSPPAVSRPAVEYALQAGAFINMADAEDMKARLALLGFEAQIRTVPDQEAIQLHKLRIGPFRNPDELNQARERLTQNGIETLLIKIEPKIRP